MEHPAEEGHRLRVVAEAEQRPQRERRVPQPAVAIVPVAHATDPLRERRGGRGDDRTGRRVGHQLQYEGAADDGVAIRASVGAASRPVAPPPSRPLDPSVGGLPQDRDDRRAFLGVAYRKVLALPGPDPGHPPGGAIGPTSVTVGDLDGDGEPV